MTGGAAARRQGGSGLNRPARRPLAIMMTDSEAGKGIMSHHLPRPGRMASVASCFGLRVGDDDHHEYVTVRVTRSHGHSLSAAAAAAAVPPPGGDSEPWPESLAAAGARLGNNLQFRFFRSRPYIFS